MRPIQQYANNQLPYCCLSCRAQLSLALELSVGIIRSCLPRLAPRTLSNLVPTSSRNILRSLLGPLGRAHYDEPSWASLSLTAQRGSLILTPLNVLPVDAVLPQTPARRSYLE
ncbi:hypothetical protein Tco_0408179 [Tanacetum coccineum]